MLVSERIITKFSFFRGFISWGVTSQCPGFGVGFFFLRRDQEKEKLTKEISELEVGRRDVKVGLTPPKV